MATVVIGAGIVLAIFNIRTIGVAAHDLRASRMDRKRRLARFKMAGASAIAVGSTALVVGVLLDSWPIQAVGMAAFLASVPIQIAHMVQLRSELRQGSKSQQSDPM